MKYYVYAYLRENGTLYYIGKVTGKRAWTKLGKKQGPMSEGSKKKLSESLKGKNSGKTRSEEVKKKLSDALRKKVRTLLSEETKQKLRNYNLGKIVGPMNDEHKRKIAEALKGKERSKKHKENLSKALKGRKPSNEERLSYLKAMEAGKRACEHCNKTTTKGNYVRWHGNNCKLLINIKNNPVGK